MYCVPAALSIITGRQYDDCVSLIKHYLGDVNVTGVFVGVPVKILDSLGYNLTPLKAEGSYTLSSFKGIKGTYLCETRGHVVVIKDGKMFDNGHPYGTTPTSHKVIRAFEVTK